MSYIIKKLPETSDYDYEVIMTTSVTPLYFLTEIAADMPVNVPAKVLVDNLLHSGNTEKRFLAYDFDGTELKNGQFVKISRQSVERELTCQYLKENDLLTYSTLTSIQQRMIEKGIII